MADEAQLADMKKKRTFRKFTYRGVDLDQLLDMNHEQLMELFPCRIRRKFSRGIKVNFEPVFTNFEFKKLGLRTFFGPHPPPINFVHFLLFIVSVLEHDFWV